MLFSDLTSCLLSLKNCSLQIKDSGGGYLFIEDLHKFVRMDSLIVSRIKDKKNSDIAKALKEQLQYLFDNFDSFERSVVGAKPKKMKK